MLSLVTNAVCNELSKGIEKSVMELTGTKIEINMKIKTNVAPEKLITSLSRSELVVAIYSLFTDYKLHGIILLDISSARKLSEILLLQAELEISDEEALDALKEFGNIVFGTLAAVISNKIGGKVIYTIPEVIIDYDVAILDSLVTPIAIVKDYVELFEFEVIPEEAEALNFKMLLMAGE